MILYYYILQYIIIMQHAQYNVHYTVYTIIHYTLYSMHYTIIEYTKHYTVYTVHSIRIHYTLINDKLSVPV